MMLFLRTGLVALLLGSVSVAPTVGAAPEVLQVLGRSNVSDYSVSLDNADWTWLRQRARCNWAPRHRTTRRSASPAMVATMKA
ncbi:hypothetical protein THH46_21815 [Pseudomonas sp. NA13]